MMIKLSIIPKKSLGQNFLINPRISDKIVATAEISKDDTILEVGPGTGSLTKKLLGKAKKVIAVEKDQRLIADLKNKFKELKNVEIIEGDILKFKVDDLKLKDFGYKIVANIPYYITSKFLKIIFEKCPRPKLIVLTIQKEVAQRIVAKPPHMNLLALSVQFYSQPKIISYISKQNFRPVPKVDSAIIKLTPINRYERSVRIYTDEFFKVTKAGFSQKRKLLINNLKKLRAKESQLEEIFKNLKISKKSRAENLGLKDWIKLVDELEFH